MRQENRYIGCFLFTMTSNTVILENMGLIIIQCPQYHNFLTLLVYSMISFTLPYPLRVAWVACPLQKKSNDQGRHFVLESTRPTSGHINILLGPQGLLGGL